MNNSDIREILLAALTVNQEQYASCNGKYAKDDSGSGEADL
jgi:hypothetical protein